LGGEGGKKGNLDWILCLEGARLVGTKKKVSEKNAAVRHHEPRVSKKKTVRIRKDSFGVLRRN